MFVSKVVPNLTIWEIYAACYLKRWPGTLQYFLYKLKVRRVELRTKKLTSPKLAIRTHLVRA
jgi:hypothetical protein